MHYCPPIPKKDHMKHLLLKPLGGGGGVLCKKKKRRNNESRNINEYFMYLLNDTL